MAMCAYSSGFGHECGLFHIKIDTKGALFDICSDFHGYTPEFLYQLIKDFPGHNYLPDERLLMEISNSSIIDNAEFLSGLKETGSFIEIELD